MHQIDQRLESHAVEMSEKYNFDFVNDQPYEEAKDEPNE